MNPLSLHSHDDDISVLDILSGLFTLGSTLGILVFAMLYFVFFNWRETDSGKAILALAASLPLLMVPSIIARTFGTDFDGWGWIRLAVYATVFVSVWNLVVVLLRAWHRGDKPLDLVEREKAKRASVNTEPISLLGPIKGDSMPTRSDRILGTIRTGIPAAVGFFVSWLISKIPAVAEVIASIDATLAQVGFPEYTTQGILTAIAIGVVTSVYYYASRWAGSRWPWVERWLLGSSKAPVYFQPAEAGVVAAALPHPDEREATQIGADTVRLAERPEAEPPISR